MRRALAKNTVLQTTNLINTPSFNRLDTEARDNKMTTTENTETSPFRHQKTASNIHGESGGTTRTTLVFPEATNFSRSVYCLLGLPIDAISISCAIEQIQSAAWLQTRCFFSTPNLNFVIKGRMYADFRDTVLQSHLSVADGMPLVWIARWLGIPITERIAGSSLFERLSRESREKLAVYFFGGPEGVAAEAAMALNKSSAGMTCVGFASPGFGTVNEMSAPSAINQINDSNPDFLVVALGAEKGQAWIKHNLHTLRVPVVSHLGAVINIVAGKITRAPQWVQRSGLEWMWRIREEPTLWRRYLSDGLQLSRILVTQIFPAILHQRAAFIPEQKFLGATFSIQNEGEQHIYFLKGPWNEKNLAPLRTALSTLNNNPVSISLDFQEVTYIDCAFLGLLCLLYGHQSKVGKHFECVGVSSRVRKIFRAHCADYLLEKRKNTHESCSLSASIFA